MNYVVSHDTQSGNKVGSLQASYGTMMDLCQ